MCRGTRKLKIKKNLWFQGVSLLIQVVAKSTGYSSLQQFDPNVYTNVCRSKVQSTNDCSNYTSTYTHEESNIWCQLLQQIFCAYTMQKFQYLYFWLLNCKFLTFFAKHSAIWKTCLVCSWMHRRLHNAADNPIYEKGLVRALDL